MKETEKRCYGGKEFRAVETTQGEKIVEGHAAVFNQRANIGGRFIEVIERGAFDNCDLSDVALFVNHDAGQIPLARTTSGTLSLTVDDVGLAIRAKLDVENNPAAKSLYSSVSRGDISKMSFAFTVDEDEWQDLKSDMPTRKIKKFKQIFEVSCVTYPAYPQTDLNARKRKEEKNMTYEEFQKHMKRYQADKTADDETDERTRLINELEAHPEKFKRADKQPPNFIPGKGFIPARESRDKTLDSTLEQREKAGKDLKDRRAVESTFNIFGERRTMTVQPAVGEEASLVVPNYSSSKINPDFPFVSSLVDAVAHLSLPGGESFTQPYLTGIGTGDYTQEAQDYEETTTQFAYAQINRAKLTAYAELTEEFEKLPAAAYADLVFQNIRTSIRKKLTTEILFGSGISNGQHRIVGIFSDMATAIDPQTDLSISQITDTTLAQIVYKYGGEENVESPSCLVLNKLDLLAFAGVRTSTKQNFYDIEYNGNEAGGKINGINFITCSDCKPLSAPSTQSGEFSMCYGNLANYLLCEFSPLEVKRSDDFKFRKGITCFRGSAIVGGNCVKKNGFIRIKKG